MDSKAFSRPKELWQIFIIALPIIAAQLLQMGMGVIDTVMAGQIDALALASIATGSSIWSFAVLSGVGLLMALPPVISQHLGAGDEALVREELRQGLWMALLTGFCLIVIAYLIMRLMPVLGIDEAIVLSARDYLLWVVWSLPFTCLYLVPRAFNEAMGFTMPMFWIQLLLLPVNVLGNYIFMFGNWGAPEMGASGAALATGIAQVLSCVLLYGYTLTAKRYAAFDLAKRMTKPDWPHITKLFRLGVPICVGLVMEAGLFTATALLMGRLGVETAAGHQIAINLASLAFMIPLGVSMALTVRVGRAVGAGDLILAKQRGQLGISVCIAIMIVTALILWLGGSLLASLYTSDAAVVLIASQLLVYAAVFQLFDGAQVGAVGVLRGYKDTKVPMLLAIFCYWVVGMGMSFYLGVLGDKGAEGLWTGLVCGLAMAAIVLNARFYWLSRQSELPQPLKV